MKEAEGKTLTCGICKQSLDTEYNGQIEPTIIDKSGPHFYREKCLAYWISQGNTNYPLSGERIWFGDDVKG